MNGRTDDYFDMLDKIQDEQRLEGNHVYKAQLMLIYIYLEENNIKEAKKYLKELINE